MVGVLARAAEAEINAACFSAFVCPALAGGAGGGVS